MAQLVHAWGKLVVKPLDHMMEGLSRVGKPRSATAGTASAGTASAGTAGTASAEPLAGATVFVLRYQSTTMSLIQTVAALGGKEAVSLEEATHCIVPSGLGLRASPATRRVLRRAKELSVAVVEATWLEIVAGLATTEHWSEMPLDSHVPPIMAVLHGDFRASDCRRSDGRASQEVSTAEASEISLSEISVSLDETWAYMRRGQPEEVEAPYSSPGPGPYSEP